MCARRHEIAVCQIPDVLSRHADRVRGGIGFPGVLVRLDESPTRDCPTTVVLPAHVPCGNACVGDGHRNVPADDTRREMSALREVAAGEVVEPQAGEPDPQAPARALSPLRRGIRDRVSPRARPSVRRLPTDDGSNLPDAQHVCLRGRGGVCYNFQRLKGTVAL